MFDRIPPETTERYLRVLGVPPRSPTLAYLEEVLHAHLWHIPFENISKLYQWKNSGFNGVSDITMFLDNIEEFHLGGTCYSINFHLHQLLLSLGFDAKLCGADMSRPDVHLVNIVRITGAEYLADCGYAAPFAPPLCLGVQAEQRIELGEDTYTLLPMDAAGRSRLVHSKNGTEHHGYLVNPKPRVIEEFSTVIADSFRPEATFMNRLVVAKFSVGQSVIIRGATIHEYNDGAYGKTDLYAIDDVVNAIEVHFSIPPTVSRIALTGLPLFNVEL